MNLVANSDTAGEVSQGRFTRTAVWNGLTVKHRREGPGHIPEHWHSEHQIVIPLGGSFTAETQSRNGRRRTTRSTVGLVYLLPSGQPNLASCDDWVEYLSIYLDPELLNRAAAESFPEYGVELVETCDVSDPVIRQIGLALMVEAQHEGPAGDLFGESLANLLAVHLLRHYTADPASAQHRSGGLAGYRLKRVTEYILENLERDLTLTEIARSVEMSPYHFARAFKQATGFAPHQYLTKSRIERAKALLAQTELPIVEVSQRVGFKSQSHFTTLFRRVAAVTPKVYRDCARR